MGRVLPYITLKSLLLVYLSRSHRTKQIPANPPACLYILHLRRALWQLSPNFNPKRRPECVEYGGNSILILQWLHIAGITLWLHTHPCDFQQYLAPKGRKQQMVDGLILRTSCPWQRIHTPCVSSNYGTLFLPWKVTSADCCPCLPHLQNGAKWPPLLWLFAMKSWCQKKSLVINFLNYLSGPWGS